MSMTQIRRLQPLVLSVGIDKRIPDLAGLPLRIIAARGGSEAIRQFRMDRAIALVVSRWDLPDMADGRFVWRVRGARPWIPIIVLLDEPSDQREVAARGVGVLAVVPADLGAELLRTLVQQAACRSAEEGEC